MGGGIMLTLVTAPAFSAWAPCAEGSYTPSALESEWTSIAEDIGKMRLTAFCQKRKELATQLGRSLIVNRSTDGSCMRCGDRQVCIEPLVEVLRAPSFPCNDGVPQQRGPPQLYSRAAEARMMDRSWLWTSDTSTLPPRTSTSATPARAFLFDLGASTWQVDGDLGAGLALTSRDNSAWSSLAWLTDAFSRAGVQFDRILAWEAGPRNATAIWRGVPRAVKASLSYYNVPVSSNPQSVDYPWAYMHEIGVDEDDLVIVKLDIDNPTIETALLRDLLHAHTNVTTRACKEHPKRCTTEDRTRSVPLYRLVDVLFHESHSNTPIMSRYWGHKMKETLMDSYRLFGLLRERGVLAHSWT